MNSAFRPLAVLLGIVGIGDLVMVPFMISASHDPSGAPPMPAIVLSAILGLATLTSIRGVTQGRRRALLVAVICRTLDIITSALGIAFGPGIGFAVVGAVTVVLSVLAIVTLIRLDPRRVLRHAATGARPAGRR